MILSTHSIYHRQNECSIFPPLQLTKYDNSVNQNCFFGTFNELTSLPPNITCTQNLKEVTFSLGEGRLGFLERDQGAEKAYSRGGARRQTAYPLPFYRLKSKMNSRQGRTGSVVTRYLLYCFRYLHQLWEGKSLLNFPFHRKMPLYSLRLYQVSQYSAPFILHSSLFRIFFFFF